MMFTDDQEVKVLHCGLQRGRISIEIQYGEGKATTRTKDIHESHQDQVVRTIRMAKRQHMRMMKVRKPVLRENSDGTWTFSWVAEGYTRTFGHGPTPWEAYQSWFNNQEELNKFFDTMNDRHEGLGQIISPEPEPKLTVFQRLLRAIRT